MAAETRLKSPIAEKLTEMRVSISLPCARCGYDMRGLAADGDCPECGEPIRLTIIEVVDPAARRLEPIHNQKLIGNSIFGIVLFYFISVVLAVFAALGHSPESLPVPELLRTFPSSAFLWISSASGLVALLNLTPMMVSCRRNELQGYRHGIALTFFGIVLWIIGMIFISMILLPNPLHSAPVAMFFDTCLPVVAAALVFSGFRKLVPRLGQRSRAFRQAQGSRQRMDDLLATLIVVIVGRTCMAVSPEDSNLSMFGLITMVISMSLVVIGLGYLLRNTVWIRRALMTPPPALSEILRPID